MAPRDIEKAFGIGEAPQPTKVAPNQVFPHKRVYKYWALMMLGVILMWGVINVTASRQKIFEKSFDLQPLQNAEGTQVVFTDAFNLKGGRNIQVTGRSNVNNTWLYVDGDFVDESTGLVQTFSLPIEYYYGSDEDGAWSEGSQESTAYVSSVPSSKYTMRLEVQWEQWQSPASISIKVEQGVPRTGPLLIAMLVLSAPPLIVMLLHFRFARRRWEDSDYSPFHSK
jgi:hypothetical protein